MLLPSRKRDYGPSSAWGFGVIVTGYDAGKLRLLNGFIQRENVYFPNR
jgi:hypothetical protein